MTCSLPAASADGIASPVYLSSGSMAWSLFIVLLIFSQKMLTKIKQSIARHLGSENVGQKKKHQSFDDKREQTDFLTHSGIMKGWRRMTCRTSWELSVNIVGWADGSLWLASAASRHSMSGNTDNIKMYLTQNIQEKTAAETADFEWHNACQKLVPVFKTPVHDCQPVARPDVTEVAIWIAAKMQLP